MRRLIRLLAGLIAGYLLLAIPGPDPAVPPAPAQGAGFVWDRDTLWQRLEDDFRAALAKPCTTAESQITERITALAGQLTELQSQSVGPEAALLDTLELRFFELAPQVAACPGALPGYLSLQQAFRDGIKAQSRAWDVATRPARERLYRALYGSRTAVEEVIVHHPSVAPALASGLDEPSATPSVIVQGVRIHSGDMLVSRGGYPTSALIARGNDFPGNFSHVALVHVDPVSGAASVIEAHIERGVAITTADGYLADKKLRILVLRPRADLPALTADPLLPHRAAERMLARARTEHVPYDFAMDYTDASRLFCSEVASTVYRDEGVTLWTGLSTISAPGLRRWLASFGVQHFETQEPSDLEYDPQLVVVAEWRDPVSLQADRVDNAVIDVMLEGAESGDALGYPWYQLPPVRVIKGWSVLLERLGRTGPVPEGMSARAALRNRAFGDRQRRIAAEVHDRIAVLERDQGYPLTYRLILELARAAAGEERER